MNWEDKQIGKRVWKAMVISIALLIAVGFAVIFAEDLVNLVNLVIFGQFESPIFGWYEDSWWLLGFYR